MSCDGSRRLLIASLFAGVVANRAGAAPVVTRVDLSRIEPGRQRIVYWDFRPHFVRRRTPEQIAATRSARVSALQDPATDESRVKNPEWVVVEARCTHAGCLPALGQGTGTGGWLCPCHGSEFDLSGRVIQGPAERNLPVPPYVFVAPDQLVIGQE